MYEGSIKATKEKYLYKKYSNERQDEFAYHMIGKRLKRKGYFLDVACGHPLDANNTYLLEKMLGWDGLSIDCGDIENNCSWSEFRNTKFCIGDVTTPQLTDIIIQNIKTTDVDYLSIDVDNAGTQLSHLAFEKIFDTEITFKVMNIEHESFRHGDLVTKPTRDYLFRNGYHLLFKDVSFPKAITTISRSRLSSPSGGGSKPFEDWWINPKFINHSPDLRSTYDNLDYNKCISIMEKWG